MEDLGNFILIWFYYAKFFILGSLMVTYLLNLVTKKLYIPPLVINMVGVLFLLLIPYEKRAEAMYVYYMPMVLTSIIMNLIIYIARKSKKYIKKK